MPNVLLLALLLSLLGASPDLLAQRPGGEPHLAYAYPAGCRQGTTCEILIGGQYLKEASEVYLAGEGVKSEVIKWYRPLTRAQYNDLRKQLQEAKERLIKAGTGQPSDAEVARSAGVSEYELGEMESFLARERDPRRQPNDQLIEVKTIRLTVEKDAPLGKRELRLLTDDTISNPLWLHIGNRPEFCETEPNNVPPRSWEPENVISELPAVVNGQIMPGDIDCFSFEARKGMHIVIQVAARDVIPYLADAVPGWFQAVLRLTDKYGKEIRYADSFHYRQDPVILYEIPKDGTYAIEIRDSLHRGREDFVYRVSIGETPFVTSVFPLGARVGSDVELQLSGWNLAQTRWKLQTMPRRQYRPLRHFFVPQGAHPPIDIPLQIGLWPETIDQEPNNSIQTSQTIRMPMTVNGRIDHPGDRDIFLIEGGGRMIAEVNARRAGSPLDSMLVLTDEHGNEIAFNDDHVDKTQSMQTHHADSLLVASVPARKTYLHISDVQQNGGSEFIYRLSLHAPQADYELRVTPSSIIARAGQTIPISVFALRKDGFSGDITVSLVDAPAGFQLSGAVIPGAAEHVRMTLTMPRNAPSEPILLEMEGTAEKRSGGRVILRPAIPAENMMQAFIWHSLVPVENWNVFVSQKRSPQAPFRVVLPSSRIILPSGGNFLLPVVAIAKSIPGDQLQVDLSEPPAGITAAIVSSPTGGYAIQLTIDQDEVERGLKGNLLMTLTREFAPKPTVEDPSPKVRRTAYGYIPAIPFEVSQRRSHNRS